MGTNVNQRCKTNISLIKINCLQKLVTVTFERFQIEQPYQTLFSIFNRKWSNFKAKTKFKTLSICDVETLKCIYSNMLENQSQLFEFNTKL